MKAGWLPPAARQGGSCWPGRPGYIRPAQRHEIAAIPGTCRLAVFQPAASSTLRNPPAAADGPGRFNRFPVGGGSLRCASRPWGCRGALDPPSLSVPFRGHSRLAGAGPAVHRRRGSNRPRTLPGPALVVRPRRGGGCQGLSLWAEGQGAVLGLRGIKAASRVVGFNRVFCDSFPRVPGALAGPTDVKFATGGWVRTRSASPWPRAGTFGHTPEVVPARFEKFQGTAGNANPLATNP